MSRDHLDNPRPTRYIFAMTKLDHNRPRPTKGLHVISVKKDADGKETWSVPLRGGKIARWTTKASSAAAMDKAVKRYAKAMKRLAKR